MKKTKFQLNISKIMHASLKKTGTWVVNRPKATGPRFDAVKGKDCELPKETFLTKTFTYMAL